MAVQFKKGQAITWRAGQGFWLDGAPFYPTGTNYVASYICTNYWEDWRPEELTKDLDRIAALGLNCVRIPIHWEFSEPAPGQFRPEMMERVGQFLSWAEERGLALMPWLLIGVATERYDVSWRGNQSYFEEPMVTHAANHIRAFIERFKDRPNILCWDLCDEPEFYANMPGCEQLPYEPVRFKKWVRRLYDAAKAADPVHPVMMGFGHLITNHYGMHAREMEQILDMMGVTGYTHDGDMELLHSFRNTYFLPWYLRMNDTQGRGVFAQEAPGWSTVCASDKSMGLHYRLVLHSMLASNCWGMLPWVWNDFVPEIWDKSPLEKDVLEPGFGLCRVDGTIKKAGEEFGAFAIHARKYPLHEWPLEGPEAHILIPSGYYTQNVELHWRSTFVAFMVARQAGLRVKFVWEEDWPIQDCKLLIVPGCPSGLKLTTWLKIEAWVAAGGTLLAMIGYQRHIYPRFNELFGVELQGPVMAASGIEWKKTPQAPAGLAASGKITPAASMPSKTRMALDPAGAEIWATNPDGQPILFAHRFKAGQAILLDYAAEMAMANLESAEFATHPLHTLYRVAAAQAGLSLAVQSSDSRLETSSRVRGQEILVTIINHTSDPVEAQISYDRPVELEETVQGSGVKAEGPMVHKVKMNPCEVQILRLKRGA